VIESEKFVFLANLGLSRQRRRKKASGYTLIPEFAVKGAGSGDGTGKADFA
jgi:hypothetical protein